MLKKIPLKNAYLLLAGTLLLLLICYEVAFKKTIEYWKINTNLKAKLVQSGDISIQPEYLERKNTNLNKLIDLYNADTTALRNTLINVVSLLADKENVKLTEVPIQDMANVSEHFIIERLHFEGDYFSLMRLSEKLQEEKGIGMVRSERWKMNELNTSGNRIRRLGLEALLEINK